MAKLSLAVVLGMPKSCKTIRLFRILRARCWLLLVKQDSAGHCGAMRNVRTFQPQAFGAKQVTIPPTNKDPK